MKYHLNRKKDVLGPHNIDLLSVFFGSLLGDAFGEMRLHKSRIVFGGFFDVGLIVLVI